MKLTKKEFDILIPLPLTEVGKIFCTNGYTSDIFSKHSPIKPARGQVLITTPIPKLPFHGNFHSNEGFIYWRNVGDRLLLGGLRNIAIKEEETTKMVTSEIIQSGLEQLMRKQLLPGRTDYQIDTRWSGIMGFTQSHNPIYELLLDHNFTYIIGACNGIGVTTIPPLAKEIADKCRFR